MPAYVILDVKITNPEAYEYYKKASGASLQAYGGQFVVRGGTSETLEGEWSPERIVVLRFESMDQARAWHDSEEYRGARELRRKAAESQLIVVDGCA
jgi:uncharacterized protein (DUF1330 family)